MRQAAWILVAGLAILMWRALPVPGGNEVPAVQSIDVMSIQIRADKNMPVIAAVDPI